MILTNSATTCGSLHISPLLVFAMSNLKKSFKMNDLTERLEIAFTHLNGQRVEEVLRGDEEADHVALAAVPAHAEVLHRGVGQKAALHLVTDINTN